MKKEKKHFVFCQDVRNGALLFFLRYTLLYSAVGFVLFYPMSPVPLQHCVVFKQGRNVITAARADLGSDAA